MEQPVRMIRAFDVPVHLRAEEAACERMIRIAGHFGCASVFVDGDEHRARIGAVVRTRSANDPASGWRGGYCCGHRETPEHCGCFEPNKTWFRQGGGLEAAAFGTD